MKISSPAFKDGESIPVKYTCDGENVNPELIFEEVPVGTVSLLLIVDDPDAAAGDWLHWSMWNIDGDTTRLAENDAPMGAVEGATDFGEPGWGGPCPQDGEHRYRFKLYALDVRLELDVMADKMKIAKEIEGQVIDKTTLTGKYKRI